MAKQKTLFKKYLMISLVIVLVSFVILGVMLVIFVGRYSSEEKRTMLEENANAVAKMISDNSRVYSDKLIIDDQIYRTVVSTMSESISAKIIVSNNKGVIQLWGDNLGSDVHIDSIIPQDIIKRAQNGGSFEAGNLGGVFETSHYTAGVPIYLNMDGSPVLIGAVFVSTDASNVVEVTAEVTRIFFFAAIATFAIVFCLVGFFTYNMVRPLRLMSQAAKSFGNGDFSCRVPITSNDEIGQLAAAFNNMADSLSLSEGTRRSFIANVSHELKTPMTTIAGFIDGILDGTIPPERESYYLNIVSVEVKRLSRLVQSMLALSRIDSGALKMQKQRFDITSTLIETLLTFEQKIEERKIQVQGLEETESIFVDGDPDMMHQVIYNLIENAVKFTNEGGYIKVTLSDLQDRTVMEIKNSGQGIAGDEITHIFERFYKTDKSRSQDKNGMGLGLYIVKTIMRLHGGDITASSEVGQYCAFTLWLPKETPKTERQKARIEKQTEKLAEKQAKKEIKINEEETDNE
ncbi:MAG: ATP-binding protein [Acutalibacteraceae bacterium]